MKLVLFHDELALKWTPFVETRPVGELLYGSMTLRARAARALGVGATSVVYAGPGELVGFEEHGAPPVLDSAPTDGDRIFLCTRAVLEQTPPAIRPGRDAATPLRVGGGLAGWFVPAGAPAPEPDALRDLSAHGNASALELPGELLARPWNLMAGNAARITADAAAAQRPHTEPPDTHAIGDHRIILEEGADVEPGVVLDLRRGPVWLAQGARVEGPARLTGPLYLGPGSAIFGGPVGTSSIGPACKVRGEIADCVIVGYCNKAHDGHLGHAVLGRWVNLGAGTINSDLKNTYSPVRLRIPEGDVDTQLLKVGSFIGDHVKTGIGTLLNTGTVIGAASNLFGGAMPPLYVPPFSWGGGAELVEYELDRFFATAQAAMKRRDVELTPGMRQILERVALKGRMERASGTGRS